MEKIEYFNVNDTALSINLVEIVKDAEWRVDFPRNVFFDDQCLKKIQQKVLNESKYAFMLDFDNWKFGMIRIYKNTARICPLHVDIKIIIKWIKTEIKLNNSSFH